MSPQVVPNSFSTAERTNAPPALTWQVHLRKRDPARLPILLAVIGAAAVCVWMLFGAWPPALAAALLLVGATRDYLFPMTYRITEEGIFAEGPGSRLILPWKEARRAILEPDRVTLTPLEHPSRLDAFRGVTLRFAPNGETGDRAAALAAVAHYAPLLIENDEVRRG